jgi:hypothetical protein
MKKKYISRLWCVIGLFTCVVWISCSATRSPEKSVNSDKIKFALETPPSTNYEFCIPNTAQNKALVLAADPTTLFLFGQGRIGCTDDQVLCVGNTLDPDFRGRIGKLCALDIVKRIEPTYWE